MAEKEVPVTVEIMLSDLSERKQQEILDILGLKDGKEGNYDVFPLFHLELYPEEGLDE